MSNVIPFRPKPQAPVVTLRDQLVAVLAQFEKPTWDEIVRITVQQRRLLEAERREREHQERQRDYAATYQDAVRDVRAAGLDERAEAMLLALLDSAYQDGARPPSHAHLGRALGISYPTAVKRLRELQGETCGGLGIDSEPIQRLSGWLYQFLEG